MSDSPDVGPEVVDLVAGLVAQSRHLWRYGLELLSLPLDIDRRPVSVVAKAERLLAEAGRGREVALARRYARAQVEAAIRGRAFAAPVILMLGDVVGDAALAVLAGELLTRGEHRLLTLVVREVDRFALRRIAA